jgi:Rtf2 RING-finger
VCTLTKEPLKMPLVICRRGLIYNKESLIKQMIEKTMPHEFRHIRKLSNLVTVSEASFDEDRNQVCCAVSLEVLSDLKPF